MKRLLCVGGPLDGSKVTLDLSTRVGGRWPVPGDPEGGGYSLKEDGSKLVYSTHAEFVAELQTFHARMKRIYSYNEDVDMLERLRLLDRA